MFPSRSLPAPYQDPPASTSFPSPSPSPPAPSSPLPLPLPPLLFSPSPPSFPPVFSLPSLPPVITNRRAMRLTGSRRISGNQLIKRKKCTTWLIHTVGDL